MYSENKIAAIIPFYNEEKTINEIITNTLNYVDLVIAVNDGSTDNSIYNIPKDNRIIVIQTEKNYGKGHALNIGFQKSAELNTDITITLDADLQHDPNYISSFIIKSINYDIIIGNRMHTLRTMPIQRRLSNKITSFFMSLKTGQKILDSQSGFRAYKTSILKDILPDSCGFEAESEIIVYAARKGYKIGFVNIPTIYGNEISKIKPIETIMGFIKVMLK